MRVINEDIVGLPMHEHKAEDETRGEERGVTLRLGCLLSATRDPDSHSGYYGDGLECECRRRRKWKNQNSEQPKHPRSKTELGCKTTYTDTYTANPHRSTPILVTRVQKSTQAMNCVSRRHSLA